MYSVMTTHKLMFLFFGVDHVALHPGESANFLQISPLYRQSIMNECQVKSGLVVNGDNITIVSVCLFELAMLLVIALIFSEIHVYLTVWFSCRTHHTRSGTLVR